MLAAEGRSGESSFQQDLVVGVVHVIRIQQGSRNAQIRMFGDELGPRGACWEEERNERIR